MSAPHPRVRTLRLPARLVAAALGIGALVASSVLSAGPASADKPVAPAGGTFVITGAGYGHGHGMSQYGVYGAAKKGLSWTQIVAFYYPGTTRRTLPATTTLRVWITADNDNSLRVLPARGLRVSDANGHGITLPASSAYRSWRITRYGSGYRLGWKDVHGKYHNFPVKLDTSTWSFSTSTKVVTVRMPNLSNREYRGSVALVRRGSGARTVNTVGLEDYVRSVVPSEMPTSWPANAVRAQAVASRSYAIRTRDSKRFDGADICDNTNCQVYGGLAVTPNHGHRTVRESSRGDAAAKATAGVVLTYKGQVALTEFEPSDGGATASGGHDYLSAHPDPYDGLIQSQAWTKTLTASAVAKAYPAAGTIRGLQVVTRDGSGSWGGRVTTIRIIGSTKTLTVSGTSFQGRFGMRSSLYRVTAPTTS